MLGKFENRIVAFCICEEFNRIPTDRHNQQHTPLHAVILLSPKFYTNSICKDNPYDGIETLSKTPSDKETAYFSNRTLKIIKNFDCPELPTVNQLIADSMYRMTQQEKMCLNI